ncbi:MAG: protein phosphatase [Nocardioidaceae bacterium]
MIRWADGPGIVEFPGGRRIRGRGLRRPLPDGPEPGFGVYLLARDPGAFNWDHRWVRWPDFRTPASTDDAIAALAEAYDRSALELVELACGGASGGPGQRWRRSLCSQASHAPRQLRGSAIATTAARWRRRGNAAG